MSLFSILHPSFLIFMSDNPKLDFQSFLAVYLYSWHRCSHQKPLQELRLMSDTLWRR